MQLYLLLKSLFKVLDKEVTLCAALLTWPHFKENAVPAKSNSDSLSLIKLLDHKVTNQNPLVEEVESKFF